MYTYCRSGFRNCIAHCVLRQAGWETAFLSGGTMTYHGFHKTPLATGVAGMPVVTHAEDGLAQLPGALTAV
ncbi:hypothetical protein [Streptomyces sp. NPDC093089]|uniref:hypothetical protein n=1 Tax=Streptomyces sp. NPDC093089 TaxID=3366024 RepID=UPI0038166D57